MNAMALGEPALYNVSSGYPSDEAYFQTGISNGSGQAWLTTTSVYYGTDSTIWWPWVPSGTADAGPWATPGIFPTPVAPIDDAIEREVAKRLQELRIQSRPAAPPPPPPKVAPPIDVDEVPRILPKRVIED